MIVALASLAMAAAQPIPPPGAHMVVPTYRQLAAAGASALYEAVLPANATYPAGAPLLLTLKGSRKEVGRDYAVLLGNRSVHVFETFLEKVFPNTPERIAFEAFADWLWTRFAEPHVPAESALLQKTLRLGIEASATRDGPVPIARVTQERQ